MRWAWIVAMAALWGGPALATSGYGCEAEGKPVSIEILIGHAIAPVVVQVRLNDGEKSWSTADEPAPIRILQAWIDDRELRLDLVDGDTSRYEARLRVRLADDMSAKGTLERGGATYRLRCSEM